jgi:putative peptidoglycan lipid II flippase
MGISIWQFLQLGTLSAVNIASNLLFQWLVLTGLGPGMLTDALFAGITLPQLFTAIVSSSLAHVLVPILAGEAHDDQRRDAWTLFVYLAVLFALVATALIFTADWWVPLTVPGFLAEAKLLTVDLARISLLGMVFTGMSAVQAAVGIARHKYLSTEAAPLVANIISTLLLVWLLPMYGVWAAAWISVLRLVVQTLLLLPLIGRPSMPNLSRPAVLIAWQRLKPMLIGAAYYKMDPLVDRFLLSAAATGSLSMLYLAQQLHSAVCQVITKAIAVPVISQLAAAHKRHDQEFFALKLIGALKVMLAICLFCVFAIWLVGQPLLTLGMAYGKFSIAHVQDLWLLLLLSAGMLVAGAVGALTAGAFYARGDTRTPTFLGSLAFTVGIALKIFMFNLYGVKGLAVAISTYYIFSLSIQLLVLWKRSGNHSIPTTLFHE